MTYRVPVITLKMSRILSKFGSSARLEVFSDLDELSLQAAMGFVREARRTVETEGRFTVCLSGGSTPRATYSLLAKEPLRTEVPWNAVHIFWGDERCIPLDQRDNHYTMTYDLMLSKVPIPAQNIHRMRGEAKDPEEAAKDYEAMLGSFFRLRPNEFPNFDLILLGMGEDGHTASLYPGTPGLKETRRLVISHYVPQRRQRRLTLTIPTINHARQVMFLVAGAAKAHALREVWADEAPGLNLPSAYVKPDRGRVVWLVDQDAARWLIL